MNFNIRNTEIFLAISRGKNPLFRFSKILKNVFLFLFIISFLLVGFSFLNFISGYLSAKMLVLFLSLYIFFWHVNLFWKFKIKKPIIRQNISEVGSDLENYNLAQFLDFDAAEIILNAINFCTKKKIVVNSTALLYFAVKQSEDINLICFRLGLNSGGILIDAKNFLENISIRNTEETFSDDFQQTIKSAFEIAKVRNRQLIGENEILVALAKNDVIFKKILIDADLKEKDLESLTLWLQSAEDVLKKNKEFWRYENLLGNGSLGKDYSTGYTITLDKFSTDWRKVVSKWKFRRIVGHEKELERVEIILGKSKNTNVLIVGDPGTGRKSIIQALAQKCYFGNSLPELNNKRVVELDPVLLAAQVPDMEKLETVLDEIFAEVASSANVILVIDNIENFVGQKIQKAGTFDISGVLAKYLPMLNFQFVGITTFEGLHKNIEDNPSFAEFFQKVEVSEVSQEDTINILQSTALELEYSRKGILISYPAIREIVNLTARYMPSLPFPGKALDILDEVVVYVQKMKGVKGYPVVLPHHVAEIVSQKTEIPIGKMEVKEKEVLLNLENLIHNRIVNQEEAVKGIAIAMRRARMGVASKTRPMGTFLFLGPTGVGKTETAKALAQIYFGSEEKMIRMDMSEFQEISDIPRLLGAISPVEMQGLLTTPVREKPFSLVLLDEIEKAHPNILNLFLQVLDEGKITDGQGRKVVFTNTIIICTSNAGAEMIFKQVEAGKPLIKDDLFKSLFDKNIFRPEFVNRFDATIMFHPLSKDNLLKIAQLSLQSLQKSVKEKDIDFIITEPLKEKIVSLSYKPEFGAREMRRVIQDNVENSVATALLEDKIKKCDKFEINPETFEVVVNPPKVN